MTKKQTHETYIMAVRDAVLHRVGKTDRKKLEMARMVYGTGAPGTRGTTYYELWKHDDGSAGDVIEICINGEESPRQIAGTVLHEMGHVLCAINVGHGPEWKLACAKVGLVGAQAVATDYIFDSEFLDILSKIPPPQDGTPGQGKLIVGFKAGAHGCKAGQGTRGGKSRGKGSGSRLKPIECPKCGYAARVTKKWLMIGLPTCPCGTLMTEKADKTNHHTGPEGD